jgi:hypothetical protein
MTEFTILQVGAPVMILFWGFILGAFSQSIDDNERDMNNNTWLLVLCLAIIVLGI